MTLLECDLPGIKKLRSGKVREVFDLGDCLLIVATDRISAFDCILPTPIPRKGEVLTQMSVFWYDVLDFIPNHFITTRFEAFPSVLHPFEAQLAGRSMLVRKAKPLPVECVARGYIAGSGWKEYQASGTVGGHEVPAGLQQSAKLPKTLFTPSTKAETGHDENITWKQCRAVLGDELAIQVRDQTIDLYEHGCSHAAQAGILIADTKFEFGIARAGRYAGRMVLGDEVLTPDSSRYWPVEGYEEAFRKGENPPSYDKQFVRDWLEQVRINGKPWDKTPPSPRLPQEVIIKTAAKYREALERLTG